MPEANISHRERLAACLAGQKPDRPPVALWRHFPVDDQAPESLAEAVAFFQRTYDFDLIKVTPASSFCVRDWGVEDVWRGNPEGTREYVKTVISNPQDWSHLRVLHPKEGALGEQLTCLTILRKEFSPDTPILQTIFNPLSQAKNLIGKNQLVAHLRQYPEALHAGLERITASTIRFIEEAIKAGIDGVFYAVQHAQFELLSLPEFHEFSRYYDLRILEAARRLKFNLLHVHGEHIMFEQVQEYPAAIINWHDRETSPTLGQGQALFKGTVCGGLRQWETLVLGDPHQVEQEAMDAIQTTAGTRFILGTGCVVPVTAPHGNILAARKAVTQAARDA